jgi:RNA polymerase sigma factor (sigma-70 family)
VTEEIPKKDYEFVEKIAYKYFIRSNYYVELDDLVQEGLLAYVKSREKYVESQNSFYMGYAYRRISGAILDYIGRNSPKGSSTVRPGSAQSTREIHSFTSAGILEEDFADHTLGDIDDEIVRLQCAEEFATYLKSLTPLEHRILYDYFILQDSIVKISVLVGFSRAKVKRIVTACLLHMKDYFEVDDE